VVNCSSIPPAPSPPLLPQHTMDIHTTPHHTSPHGTLCYTKTQEQAKTAPCMRVWRPLVLLWWRLGCFVSVHAATPRAHLLPPSSTLNSPTTRPLALLFTLPLHPRHTPSPISTHKVTQQ